MEIKEQLEKQGYKFHSGSRSGDRQRFQFCDAPFDSCPPLIADLEAMGYIFIEGGTMEPPKGSPWPSVVALAILGVGIYAIGKFFENRDE